jgi:hypothetical protein
MGSAGTHQAMSNWARWRWAYSITAVVLPIPPMPVTHAPPWGHRTAPPPPARRAARSASEHTGPRRDRPYGTLYGGVCFLGAGRLVAYALQIGEHRCWALGVVAEQEHQPGHPPLLGGLVLQLGVGQLRPVAHR